MLTDSFLNSCYSLILCNDEKIIKNKAIPRDILEIITFYETKEALGIPLNVKLKTECLKRLCYLKMEEKTVESMVDSILTSEKYKNFSDFLETKSNKILKDEIINDYMQQIALRKKLIFITSNYDDVNNCLIKIRDGSYESLDELIDGFEVITKQLYCNMMEHDRNKDIELTTSIDFIKDDWSSVIKQIKKKYSRVFTTPTGFPVLDNEIMINGGFEPSRLYIIGGGSGAGKSTLMNNFILNAALHKQFGPKSEDGDINKVFIYITLENLIDEAVLRTYMSQFSKKIPQVLSELVANVDIKKKVVDELIKNNSTIIMKYRKPFQTGVFDLAPIVDDAISIYGRTAIKGLYVDYLDILKSDINYKDFRLMLSYITSSLKTLAVMYNIPVITVTQLTRSVYRITSGSDLNLDQMSESIKKVEHADLVALLARNPLDDTLVHMKIGKNRCGPSNITIDFKADFEIFKFISGYKVKAGPCVNQNSGKFDPNFTSELIGGF